MQSALCQSSDRREAWGRKEVSLVSKGAERANGTAGPLGGLVSRPEVSVECGRGANLPRVDENASSLVEKRHVQFDFVRHRGE